MPQSLAKILVRTALAIKRRCPFLRDKNLRDKLCLYDDVGLVQPLFGLIEPSGPMTQLVPRNPGLDCLFSSRWDKHVKVQKVETADFADERR